MRTKSGLILLILLTGIFYGGVLSSQELWTDTKVNISFYSHAPIEDITAASSDARSVINTGTGDIFIEVNIPSFVFEKNLMRKHFNEQYMESDKFPKATFKGKIKNEDGGKNIFSGNTFVEGELTIHGIKREIREKVTLKKEGDIITGYTRFKVRTSDFGIKVPSILTRNIAEEIEITATTKYKRQ